VSNQENNKAVKEPKARKAPKAKKAKTPKDPAKKKKGCLIAVIVVAVLAIAFSIFAMNFCAKRYETKNFLKVGFGWIKVSIDKDATVTLVDEEDRQVIMCNRDNTESGLLDYLGQDAPFGIESRFQQDNQIVLYQSERVAKAEFYYKRKFGLWIINYISMEDYAAEQEAALNALTAEMNDNTNPYDPDDDTMQETTTKKSSSKKSKSKTKTTTSADDED